MTPTLPPAPRRLWFTLFLPFAFGYFLSYLFRSVNAVIGPELLRDLGLDDASLGLLTSVYFLAFGAAQIPLGLALDRYGPRRTEAALLCLAALGALVFALSEQLSGLALGRVLIGLGVSACLMASFKAFALWFAPQHQAALTGAVMAAGGLGALAAASPLEWGLQSLSWQTIFVLLGALTLLCAAAIFFLAPEQPTPAQGTPLRTQIAEMRSIYRSRVFWRYAPFGMLFTGGFMAIQGLWATRWAMSVEELSRAGAAERLSLMSLSMLAGFLLIAAFSTPLQRRGVSAQSVFLASMGIGSLALVLSVLVPHWSASASWAVFALGFAFSNLAFALLAQHFPLALSGRVNTAYNLFLFLGAFGLQWGFGLCVEALQNLAAYSETQAYRATFSAFLLPLAASYVWLLRRTSD